MNYKKNYNQNYFINCINKIFNEYKKLMEYTRSISPFKIVEILELSNVPGESKFLIQIAGKNQFLQLTAAELILKKYDLNHFNNYHGEIIKNAARGTLIEFINNKKSCYIEAKKFDRQLKQYIFTLRIQSDLTINRSATEISKDKNILSNLPFDDVYDVGYTLGSESILEEIKLLKLLKANEKVSVD